MRNPVPATLWLPAGTALLVLAGPALAQSPDCAALAAKTTGATTTTYAWDPDGRQVTETRPGQARATRYDARGLPVEAVTDNTEAFFSIVNAILGQYPVPTQF